MQLYEPPGAVPQLHQALDSLRHGGAHRLANHDAALAVVHLAVHEGEGVISNIRVGGQDVRVLRFLNVALGVLTVDVLHGLVKQLGQVCALDGGDGVVLPPVLRALGAGRAEHHLRVVEEVAVDREALRRRADVYPLRQLCRRSLASLEKNDVRDDVRPGIGTKGVVGEPNRAEQLAALGEVAPHALVPGV